MIKRIKEWLGRIMPFSPWQGLAEDERPGMPPRRTFRL